MARPFYRTAMTAAATTSIDGFIYSTLLSSVHIHIIIFDMMHFESLSDYVFNERINVNWILLFIQCDWNISHAMAKFLFKNESN